MTGNPIDEINKALQVACRSNRDADVADITAVRALLTELVEGPTVTVFNTLHLENVLRAFNRIVEPKRPTIMEMSTGRCVERCADCLDGFVIGDAP